MTRQAASTVSCRANSHRVPSRAAPISRSYGRMSVPRPAGERQLLRPRAPSRRLASCPTSVRPTSLSGQMRNRSRFAADGGSGPDDVQRWSAEPERHVGGGHRHGTCRLG